MKYLLSLCLLTLSLPLLAQTTLNAGVTTDPPGPGAFPIEVDLQAEGLDIETDTSNVGNVVAVILTNQGEQRTQCTVTFHNGPEVAGPVRVNIAPGAQVEATESLQRAVIRVRADVECERA